MYPLFEKREQELKGKTKAFGRGQITPGFLSYEKEKVNRRSHFTF
jgi:hypothetical protein